jgi:site-specific DNA recombinase
MKALVYCRVSTRNQEQEVTSLESQEAACVKHAESLGYEVGRLTREVYSGAELWDRPQLSKDRADLKAGHFQALIAYATDRLSRDPIHLAIIADECNRAGVELVFVSEPLDSSREGALIRYVKGYASSIEREKIRERTMRGKHTRLAQGKVQNWGFPPYGYRWSESKDTRVIYDPEAAIVRRMYRMVAEDGLGLVALARRLNAEGVPSPGTGKYKERGDQWEPHWGQSQVSRILRRPDYKGDGYALLCKPGKKKGQVVSREQDEKILLPAGSVPAIVSPELWQAVQERINDHRTRYVGRGNLYLLSGFIFCAVCGRPMSHEVENGRRRIYRCSSRVTFEGRCAAVSVRADNKMPRDKFPRNDLGQVMQVDEATRRDLSTIPGVESWGWDQVSRILQDPSLIAKELERRREVGVDSVLVDDLSSARHSLDKIDQQQARLVRKFSESENESFPWELVQREIENLEVHKKQLQSTVGELEARIERDECTRQQLDSLQAYCARVGLNLSGFDLTQKRFALDALGVRVYANGAEWRLECNLPVAPVTSATDQQSKSWEGNTSIRLSFRVAA